MKPISVFTLGGNIDRKIIGVGLDTTGITKGDDRPVFLGRSGYLYMVSLQKKLMMLSWVAKR